MNSEIATAAAWRPTDAAVRLGKENDILARFEKRLEQIRLAYRHDRFPGVIRTPGVVAMAKIRHRTQRKLMNAAIARVTAELAAAGVDVRHTWHEGQAS